MSGFILRKLLRGILTLWFIVTVVFFATRLSGQPIQYLLPEDATQQQIEATRAFLGLDKPLHVQYGYFFSSLAQGEFGNSFFARRPVIELFAERLPATLQMALPAFLLSILIGLPIGITAALHHNSPLDRLFMSFAFLGQALPNFVLGIGLILIFSLVLKLLPSGGMTSWQSYLMPTITLGTASAAILARLTRSSLLDVLSQDYMRSARSKGLSHAKVVLKHGLRNGILPVITILGLQLGDLIAGSVVVETIFAWPGAGRLITNAVLQRDYPVVQFSILVVAVTVVLANLSVDLLYGVLDPRMRRD